MLSVSASSLSSFGSSDMPPQPLSNVKSEARVIIGAEAAKLYPELAALAAEIIATWSQVDLAFNEFLVAMLGADAAPYVEMHKDIISVQAKMAAVKATARVALSKHAVSLFDELCKKRNRLSKFRNDIAHWPWAHSPDVPNAILLCDPTPLLEYTLANVDQYLGLPSSCIIGSAAVYPSLHPDISIFDPAAIYVYREGDLTQICKDIWGLYSELAVFHVALIGSNVPGWHETMHQMLSGAYQTSTARPQPHKDQKTSPSRRQRSRPSTPRGK